jgi:hypothetical protein
VGVPGAGNLVTVGLTPSLGVTFCPTQPFHHVRIAMIEEAALFGIQCCNCSHVFGAEFNIKNVEILSNSFLADGLGNRHDAALGQPAQNDLCDGFLVGAER